MSYRTELWWSHARWPLLLFVIVATPLAFNGWDIEIAHRLYFDSVTAHWRGARSFWASTVVHEGGRWMIRAIAVLLLSTWALGYAVASLSRWRRAAGYAFVAIVLAAALVGLLKTITNVDCPWDLQEFGGRFPFVHLFGARPDGLRPAHCFPAAHASSGYALVALYFALRERYATLANWGLVAGLVTGLVFGIAQQARGAHFLSHDVWSAFLVWMTALSLYVFAFDARLWPAQAPRGQRSQGPASFLEGGPTQPDGELASGVQ